LEVNQIKFEIKILKEENQELKKDVNLLKVEQKLKKASNNQDDDGNNTSSDNEEPPNENTSHFEENCLSHLNRIQIKKWHSKVKIRVQDFEFSVIVLIDSVADLNCIQEGLVSTKYYSKSKETLRSANNSKMEINFEINKAYFC
jgi:hypothetical protein